MKIINTKNLTKNFYPNNFAKVDNFLMRSAFPSKNEIAYLKNNEFLTDIVNLSNNAPKLALNNEEQTVKELGIFYHKIPSIAEEPSKKNIELFLQTASIAKQNPNRKMLVHCNAGADRTGTYVVFYELFNKLKSFDEAIYEMKQMGHVSEFFPGLLSKIKAIAQNMNLIG